MEEYSNKTHFNLEPMNFYYYTKRFICNVGFPLLQKGLAG